MPVSSDIIRIFVGIFPPQDALQRIKDVQNEVKNLGIYARWEETAKFHVTLSFLGDKSRIWTKDLYTQLGESLRAARGFSIELDTVGIFPNRYAPKVFWIGSSQGKNHELHSLVALIDGVTATLGHDPEVKPYAPHITLGRSKGKIYPALIQRLETVTFQPIQFRCSEIKIIHSTLHSSGSMYSPLFTIPLI